MKRHISLFLLIIICSPFLISCWDLTEIEEIGFILAIALDPVPNEEEKISEMEREMGRKIPRKEEHGQLFNATFNVAIPSKIEAQEGGRTGRAFFNVTTTSLTNFQAVRQIAARRSRRLNFEHLKAIIINEELVKNNPMLEHLADFYIRDHEMRRRTYIFITPDDASDVIENRLPLEEMISTSIVDINENYDAMFSMLPPTTIGEVATNITGESSFLIPRIVANPTPEFDPYTGDLAVKGGAVFLGKENTMLGWLGEEDIRGYNWVMENANNAIIEVQYDEDEAEIFVFEVITMATTINYKREKGTNIFDVEVRAEGAFGESWLHDVEIADEKTLEELEARVEKEIIHQVEQIIDKMQNEFHADIFGFYKKVKQKEYSYWKTVDDQWDGKGGEFEASKVNVNAKVKIRHYMLNERVE